MLAPGISYSPSGVSGFSLNHFEYLGLSCFEYLVYISRTSCMWQLILNQSLISFYITCTYLIKVYYVGGYNASNLLGVIIVIR